MNNKVRSIISYVSAILLLLFLASMLFTMNREEVTKLKYYEVLELFEDGKVESYTLDLGTGALTAKIEGDEKELKYTVPNVSVFLGDVERILDKNGTDITAMQPDYVPIKETPWWVSLIPTLLLVGAMAVFWVVMMRQQGGGGKVMNFAKANYTDKNSEKPTTFKDVAGC